MQGHRHEIEERLRLSGADARWEGVRNSRVPAKLFSSASQLRLFRADSALENHVGDQAFTRQQSRPSFDALTHAAGYFPSLFSFAQ